MIDYYLIFGMVVVAIIAIYAFIRSVKNDEKSDEEEKDKIINLLHDLEICITRLNEQLKKMSENDSVRDKRIEKHGNEIDELKTKTVENEHVLANHETRIKSLEQKTSFK